MPYTHITTDSKEAARIIQEGRVVAFPTSTSYGLAADALQGHALQRLRNLKRRPQEKTFTIFMREGLWDEFITLTDEEQMLLQNFAEQPLTILVKPKKSLEHLSEGGRVGFRVIDHPLMDQLADAVDVPLTATSANISGRKACLDTACILKEFPGLVDPADSPFGDISPAGPTTYDLSLGCILDGGTLKGQLASTIVKLERGRVEIVRPGPVTREHILEHLPQ